MTKKQILQGNQVAEVLVTYSQKIQPHNRITIHNSEDAAAVFKSVWEKDTIELRETFKVMLLNQRMQVLGIVTISEGGISGTFVDIRLVFSIALKALSTRIILAHNHPSSNRFPSKCDIEISRQLIEAGKLLNIAVLDHIIITKDEYTSMLTEEIIETDFVQHPQVIE